MFEYRWDNVKRFQLLTDAKNCVLKTAFAGEDAITVVSAGWALRLCSAGTAACTDGGLGGISGWRGPHSSSLCWKLWVSLHCTGIRICTWTWTCASAPPGMSASGWRKDLLLILWSSSWHPAGCHGAPAAPLPSSASDRLLTSSQRCFLVPVRD